MNCISNFRLVAILLAGTSLCLAAAQDTSQDPAQPVLTLDQAIQLAKQQNGDVRAAVMAEKGARARVDAARAEFFPTITPSYTYNSRRTQVLNPVGPGTVFSQNEGG